MARHWAWTGLFSVTLVCALTLAGCGGSPATGDSAEAATSSEEGEAAADGERPQVELVTNVGKIVLELDPKAAPLTVDNFLKYVEEGKYDGCIFHQVISGYVVASGGYEEGLQPIECYETIRNEARNGKSNRRGTVAMARDPGVIDSSTSQFFVNLDDNSDMLDHADDEKYGYCVFGEVVEGMDVCDQISEAPVESHEDLEAVPVETVMIESARRIR